MWYLPLALSAELRPFAEWVKFRTRWNYRTDNNGCRMGREAALKEKILVVGLSEVLSPGKHVCNASSIPSKVRFSPNFSFRRIPSISGETNLSARGSRCPIESWHSLVSFRKFPPSLEAAARLLAVRETALRSKVVSSINGVTTRGIRPCGGAEASEASGTSGDAAGWG